MRTKIEQANVQKMENETKNFCGNRIFPVSRVRLFFFSNFFFYNLQGKKIEEFNKITLSIWAK